jgi:2-C-methyl-D-erythritol 4-phosphate cytidylyltransferase/2-C-methyl-D-erythritol 2,4-cyclodiphosphate synthase
MDANRPGSKTALIVAGGAGLRLGFKLPKPLVLLGRRPLVSYALQAFADHPDIAQIVLVCGSGWKKKAEQIARRWGGGKIAAVVPGGAERPDSVRVGLAALPSSCSQVAIHDAARPFVKPSVVSAAFAALDRNHGAVPGIPLVDTLRRARDAQSLGALNRSEYILTQTPQCFHRDVIEEALHRAEATGFRGTDDAAYVEQLPGARIAVTAGDPDNFKITTPQDLEHARRMLSTVKSSLDIRIGEGFDAHRLTAGRRLILGGVQIPFDRGLSGHSDADVLCHAIGDGLLGAAALGDLGTHFPDSDPAYAGISSLLLLSRIASLLRDRGFQIINVDATLILESPKIAPHRSEMIRNIAAALDVDEVQVSVKATTTEGMGYEGRGEGVSCRAVVSVKRRR